jgi:hypothetical protein
MQPLSKKSKWKNQQGCKKLPYLADKYATSFRNLTQPSASFGAQGLINLKTPPKI